jgi:hypothetical protein
MPEGRFLKDLYSLECLKQVADRGAGHIQETRRSSRSERLARSAEFARISRNIRPAIVSSAFGVNVLADSSGPGRGCLALAGAAFGSLLRLFAVEGAFAI